MPIPESQLERWSHQGAVASSQATHQSIRNVLDSTASPICGRDFDVYLQGSYRNYTNIRGDSDVDIVVQLNSTFQSDLSLLTRSEVNSYRATYQNAAYGWADFREAVLAALRSHYSRSMVLEGNKSIKILRGAISLSADVVVAIQYRKYISFGGTADQDYLEGLTFYALRDCRWVVNYPKLHYANGVEKNSPQRTGGRYKPTVRLFKNARMYMAERGLISRDLVPSYFLECLLYNVSDTCFYSCYVSSYVSILGDIIDALRRDDCKDYLCQNRLVPLFGTSPEQCSTSDVIKLINALLKLWNEW